MTAEERYNIALNIFARVGVDGDVIGEFAKAMSRLNAFSTVNDMETQGLSAGMQQGQPIQPPMEGQPSIPPTNDFGGGMGEEQQVMM